MHIQSTGRNRIFALVAAGLAASCVGQQKYDQSVGLARTYQTQLHDLQRTLADVEGENERLKAELRQSEAAVLNASFSDDVEARVSELQQMLDELGRPPGPIERFEVEGGYVFLIQDKILFASGSADLEEGGRGELLKLAAEIAGAPHGRVFVRGHTDSDPVKRPATVAKFPHGNLQLSAARAVAVAALLIAEGNANPRDVVVAGYGQWEPVAPNDSAESKRLNRRVEIFVADPAE